MFRNNKKINTSNNSLPRSQNITNYRLIILRNNIIILILFILCCHDLTADDSYENYQEYYREGIKTFNQRNWSKSAYAWQQAVKMSQTEYQKAVCNSKYGACLLLMRKFQDCIEPLKFAVKHLKEKDKINAEYHLATAYRILKIYPEAIEHFENILKNSNASAKLKTQANIYLSEICIHQKKYDKALKYSEGISPDSKPVFVKMATYNIACIYFNTGKHEKAIEKLSTLLENNTISNSFKQEIIYKLGICLKNSGKSEMAIEKFRQLINMDGVNPVIKKNALKEVELLSNKINDNSNIPKKQKE